MKKPIAVWLTDTHLKDDTIEINKSIFNQVLQLCIDNEIPGVIHGGDVFDNRRKGQPESVLVAFAEILSAFQSNGINFVSLVGNHDKQDLLGIDSTLNAFEGWAGFFLYKDYAFIDHSAGKLRFHFLPYFDERLAYQPRLDKAVENIRFDFTNILFTHISIDGVKNNDGTKVSNDLVVGKFKHFEKVLVGHYHNRQSFNNIIYTGSAYAANFGEDDEKGCTVIYSDGSIEFVKLDFPRYITQVVKVPGEKIIKPKTGDHLRVKVQYKAAPLELVQLQKDGHKIIYDFKEEGTEHVQDIKTQFTKGDIITYFDQWCTEKKIKNKEFGIKLLTR